MEAIPVATPFFRLLLQMAVVAVVTGIPLGDMVEMEGQEAERGRKHLQVAEHLDRETVGAVQLREAILRMTALEVAVAAQEDRVEMHPALAQALEEQGEAASHHQLQVVLSLAPVVVGVGMADQAVVEVEHQRQTTVTLVLALQILAVVGQGPVVIPLILRDMEVPVVQE